MYDAKSSIAEIETEFPDLSGELHDEIADGLLHVQMGVFSHLAQAAIDDSNVDLWDRITSVFVRLYTDCSPDVENALNVSFLEHLHFTDGKRNRSWADKAMPAIMKRAWQQMDAYNRSTHGG